MANIKSAIKRIETTERKTLRNRIFKSIVKTEIKKFEAALESGNLEDAKALLSRTAHILDKASSKGILHKNAVSRKKSRLAVKLNHAVSK
jgi:small subunit ribosomal protein S20